MTIFEKGTRLNLRFNTGKGFANIQDLWNLSLSKLRSMYQELTKDDKPGKLPDYMQEDSKAKTKEERENELRAAIISRIYQIRKEEKDLAVDKAAKDAKIAQIRELIKEKKAEEMKNMSIEDLKKELESLT